MQFKRSADNPGGGLVHAFALASAMILASALSLVCGFVFAHSLALDTRNAIILASGLAVGLVTVQLALQTFLVLRSARIEAAAGKKHSEATTRGRQVRHLVALADAIDREVRFRRIVTVAIDFFAQELGASNVVYWKLGVDKEPALPFLARVSEEAGSNLALQAAYRAVVTRQSSRDMKAMYLHGQQHEPRYLDKRSPPLAPVHLFLPLPGADQPEGLLEVTVEKPGWDMATWSIVEQLAVRVGAAIERSRRFEEVQERADVDYVTGAFTHRFMQTYLQRVLAASTPRNRPVAVLLLDVDGFKAFNDTLGHGAGDQVLLTVASELKRIAGRKGVVGRCGGDEFMVVLPDQSSTEAAAFREAMAEWLASDAALTDGDMRIRMSCGSAVYPKDARSRQELLALADARLYRAKARGEGVVPRTEGRSERTVGVYGVLDRILDTLQQRDNFTRRHCEKTADFAVALAQELGLSTSAQRTLRLGGLLHDIGKIGVPAKTRERATGEPVDPALIEHQLAIADNLIADVPNAEEVRRVIRDHHANWDGSGYPSGVSGNAIPILARVLAVADSYSAIGLSRPGMTQDEAYTILEAEAGGRLDPELVQRFSDVLRRRRDRDEAGHAEAVVP